MQIWIRSQDKTSLVECKTIDVIKRVNGECHIHANYMYFGEAENYIFLGKYSTKEKAIKVLDMIQGHLNEANYFGDVSSNANWDGSIVTANHEVFEMPQDNEVEV